MAKTNTALITGAAARVGREMALSLARKGWDIVVHYGTSEKPAQALATEIRDIGRKAHLVQADLRDAKAVAKIIPALARKAIALDCLVNSAAAFEKDTLATFTPESASLHMEVNLLAPLQLTRDFAAEYKGSQGCIINITDGLHGWSMGPAFLTYALSKQGLLNATHMLARELAPCIRVNAIAPGATLPGKQDKKDTFAKLKKIIPLRRASSPDEICDAMHYILSAPSLTGQVISLSGGMDIV